MILQLATVSVKGKTSDEITTILVKQMNVISQYLQIALSNIDSTNVTMDDGTSLNDFITDLNDGLSTSLGEISENQSALQTQVDGKIETYFTDTDPNVWAIADRLKHNGDMWYAITAKLLKRYNGSTNTWQLIEDQKAIDAYADASKAQDTADGKRRVFTTTPVPPYDIGDLWAGGMTSDLMKCKTAKSLGQTYLLADWVIATKYTDDSALATFVSETYGNDISDIQTQISHKRQIFSTTPTVPYEVGDLWARSTVKDLMICIAPKTVLQTYDVADWGLATDYVRESGVTTIVDGLITTDFIEALGISIDVAQISQALVVGTNVGIGDTLTPVEQAISEKRRVFTTTPVPPYDIGDLWLPENVGELKTCQVARTTGLYTATDWRYCLSYTTPTGVVTIIDGEITADRINALNIVAGSISANDITAGTISGVDIDVSSDVYIGDHLIIDDTNNGAGIRWGTSSYHPEIYFNPASDALIINAVNGGIVLNGGGHDILCDSDLLPAYSNSYALGNSSYKWAALNVGGDASIGGRTYFGGQTYFADAYSRIITTRAVYVNLYGTLGTVSSSRRFKENIKPFEFDYDALMKLPIISFTYKPEFSDDSDIKQGTTAEDAFDLGLLEFVGRDEDGVIDYFAYEKLNIANLQLIQKQDKTIKNMEERISRLEGLIK